MSVNPPPPASPPGPPHLQHPQAAPAEAGATAPRPEKKNPLGLIALVTALLGCVFAAWEGAYLVGWILLPVAFVLSLVALFNKRASRPMAVIALILSILGPIIGAVAFMGSVGRAVENAAGGDTTVASLPADAQGAAAGTSPGAPATAPAPGGKADVKGGTRENPLPVGSTVSNQDWKLTVNSIDVDATAKVQKENQFNDELAADQTHALVNVTVQRVAEKPGTPVIDIDAKYVTRGGNVINSYDNYAAIPEPLSTNELYQGASATGNIGLIIPKGDDGLFRIRVGLFGEELFFSPR